MPRVLLVVPTSSYRVADFLEAAAALDVEVAVAAEEELPLLGVDRFVRIDCSDPVAAASTIADLAATTSIDAIVPVDDTGVVIAALASELLGLPHNPPAAAAATRDKAAMRRVLVTRRGSTTRLRGGGRWGGSGQGRSLGWLPPGRQTAIAFGQPRSREGGDRRGTERRCPAGAGDRGGSG